MPKVNIDLAQEYHSPCACDASDPEKEVYYPSFRIEGDKKLEFPESGEMTIKFKKIAFSMDEVKNGIRYSCTIQVNKITELYPEVDNRPSKRDTSAEEALDAIAAEVSKKRKEY